VKVGLTRGSGGAIGILMGLVALLPVQAAGPGTFQPVGPMTVARDLPTVTPLSDGSILITGGATIVGGQWYPGTATTERFDPKTSQFVVDTRMSVARGYHSAAVLSDGRVLILGGLSNSGKFLATAEVYDPATRVFTRVGDMTGPRWEATATPLLDGRVLVVGGRADGGNSIATAELFDPGTGKFSATGSLAVARRGHAAVRLADGRVVIVGGLDGTDQTPRRVEGYDPVTGTFSPQGELVTGRAGQVALPVPGGKILLAGGFTANAPGQWENLDSIEIYDPGTGQSTITGHLSAPRYDTAAVALADGRILMAGGWTTNSDLPLRTADLIDPVTGQASPTASMNGPRVRMGAILLPDGQALLVGGKGADVLKTALVYIP
jgi:hypothetical protein